MTKDFWKWACIRAVKTFFQTILGMWTAGMVITQIDWKTTLLAAFSAAVYSLLTSVVAGLPEVQLGETVIALDNDPYDEETDVEDIDEEFEGDDE